MTTLVGISLSLFSSNSDVYPSRRPPASEAVDIKVFCVRGRGFVLRTTGARGTGHTKMRVQMQLTDVRCWDCGNLVTDLDRRGFRNLALGKDNKIKQVIKGIRAGRLDSG